MIHSGKGPELGEWGSAGRGADVVHGRVGQYRQGRRCCTWESGAVRTGVQPTQTQTYVSERSSEHSFAHCTDDGGDAKNLVINNSNKKTIKA